jgi:hypothetical protein
VRPVLLDRSKTPWLVDLLLRLPSSVIDRRAAAATGQPT